MLKNKSNESGGYTLVEVLIAVAILAAIGVAVLTALTTATKARAQADVRTTAVTMAVTTIEAVKNQTLDYDWSPNSLTGGDYTTTWDSIKANFPANFLLFTLDNTGTLVADKVYGLPWNLDDNVLVYGGTNPADPGIQKVTVIIQYNGEE
ncbi:MAG: type II secretion system protein [Dehalococcoidales bacterium]|nr:type II secretion system protein [Dehalococcoidales bacterium]